MSKHTISFELSVESVDKALAELKEYKKWLRNKKAELLKRLADFGAEDAQIRFDDTMYEYFYGKKSVPTYPTTTVSVNKCDGGGWSISANGQQVCFIEFGAGVTYNGTDSYPGTRPAGIVGIGEYGDGGGANRAWVINSKNKLWTYGIQEQAPMWHTVKDMQAEITRIAREVFA